MNIKLGQKVKDRVTGFEGIVIGITKYLSGCDTVGIQPQGMKDGKSFDVEWYDYTRLEILDKKSILEKITATLTKDPGGPQPIPQRGH